MARPGPLNSLCDVTGLTVGCAEDAPALTGVTVIVPDKRAVCAVDVRGGGPGTRETDVLAMETLADGVDAIVFSGGSVYGLAAADGVTTMLGAEGKGFGLVDLPGVPRSPNVPAAILSDLANGGNKAWGEAAPYAALGRRAYNARQPRVPLGNAGAGMGATAGALKGGQGSASVASADGYTVAALACVNCFGAVTMPGSRAFWSWPFEVDAEFGAARPDARTTAAETEDWDGAKYNPQPRTNTTLVCVATDAELSRADAKRVAQMASAGVARAIRPVFAPFDGDVIFALSTAAKPLAGPKPLALARIGAMAADCVARAIARGVYEAAPIGVHKAWRS